MEHQKPGREEKYYAFFCNRDCEYFPCHDGVEEDDFNCLFCYCPLYSLGVACGGGFALLENGVKDCSACGFPHRRENYGAVTEKCAQIVVDPQKK